MTWGLRFFLRGEKLFGHYPFPHFFASDQTLLYTPDSSQLFLHLSQHAWVASLCPDHAYAVRYS